jgi:hypothetical protein
VDDHRWRSEADQRRLAAEEAGFGGVSVDDIGMETACDRDELPKCPQVVHRIDGLAEAR